MPTGFRAERENVIHPAADEIFRKIKQNRVSAERIPDEDLRKIISLYGEEIGDIYELNPGQSWMFRCRPDNKYAFYLQFLLEAEMKIEPESFREKVNNVCRKWNTLRFAYAYRNLTRPYGVELKNRTADVYFRDLSGTAGNAVESEMAEICEADRERGFDLEKDPLLRIGVFRTETRNRYYFLISQPHINSDGESLGMLIKDIFIDYALAAETAPVSSGISGYRKYAEYLRNVDKESELAFWKEYLKDLPAREPMPGYTRTEPGYSAMICSQPFPQNVADALTRAQKKYRTTVFSILQTAWGLMLSRITGSGDIVFGSVSSGRDAEVLESMSIPGGFVKMIPVRVRLDENATFGELVRSVQASFAAAQANSHCSLDEICSALGRKEDIFDHVLNYHNFMFNGGKSGGMIGLPGFRILGGDAYDNLATDFAVYFRTDNGQFGYTLEYNSAVFSKETVLLYADCFQKIMEQAVCSEEDRKIREFEKFDAAMFSLSAQAWMCRDLKKARTLKKNDAFRNVPEEALLALAKKCTVKTYRKHEIIYGDGERLPAVPLILRGKVEICRLSSDGWYNPMNVMKDGAVLSMSGLVQEQKTGSRAEAYSDTVEILHIPCSDFIRHMAAFPGIGISLIASLNDRIEKLERLWVNN